MEIRRALIEQNPSLALQRAAMDEIARLDALVLELKERISNYSWALEAAERTIQDSGNYDWK